MTNSTLPPAPDVHLATDALFLDFDGTLAVIADHPDNVVVEPDLVPVLRALFDASGGALAIVSGRSLAFLDQRLGWTAPFVAAVHGLEMRGVSYPVISARAMSALDDWRKRLARDAGGLLVEDKVASIALHYRANPALAETAERLASEVVAQSDGALTVQPGKMVVEVKPSGVDKGSAVRCFMALPAFAGRRPVYAGDDLTDEQGFAAAAEFGGHGVLVGVPRPTAARFRLDDVAAVHQWLARATDRTG